MADSGKYESPRPQTKQKVAKNSALTRIRVAAGVAIFSAALTTLAIFLTYAEIEFLPYVDYYAFIDVALLAVLAVLLLAKKSRIASVLLLAYYIFAKVLEIAVSRSFDSAASYGSVVFIIAYVLGVMGTFTYQKIVKAEKSAPLAPPEVPPPGALW